MIAMIFNDWNDGCWLFGIASGFEGLRDEGGWGSPSCPSSPAYPARCARAPFATKGAGPVSRPALFGGPLCPSDISPASGGNPDVLCPSDISPLDFVLFGGGNPVTLPLDSGCRRNDESVAGDGVGWWFWFGESLFLRRCASLPSRCLGRSRTAPTGCGSRFWLGWWLFAVPRPFARPGRPHPGPSRPHNPYERVLLASVVPRSPFVLRTFPPRAGEGPGPALGFLLSPE